MISQDNFEIITKDITIPDLPDDLKFIATFCGMNVVLSLIQHTSGMNFYIPKNCLKELKKRYIIKNYTGTRSNVLKICHVCDVTERYVRMVVKSSIEKVKAKK